MSAQRVSAKEVIAKRVAQELRDGDRVNLGIGLPTLVAAYLSKSIRVHFHSENGIMGMSPLPGEGFEDPSLTDAGGRPVGAMPGACAFDSAFSFGLIRGGHLDVTVLGGWKSTKRVSSRTGWYRERWCRAWAARWISSQVRVASSSQ